MSLFKSTLVGVAVGVVFTPILGNPLDALIGREHMGDYGNFRVAFVASAVIGTVVARRAFNWKPVQARPPPSAIKQPRLP